jgi:radical SAM superfamily enzyme YgiQ (UPF0313 family)
MKIGLIAMSGIRVCDAELLRMGFTLPGFVERSKVIAALPSLGLLTLAGMTPESHEVTYLEIPDLAEHLKEKSLPDHFDIVGISSYSAQIDEAYQLADEYRRVGVPVVLGGPHVTTLPGEARAHCDAVVVGEGEPVWSGVLSDTAAGTLKPVYGVPREEFDLAQAPMPAFELLDPDKYNRLTVQTSRGCPHLCEFCAGSILIAGHYKQKPVEKVLAEIDRICEIWPRPFIEFADDNSFVNMKYWKQLLPELKDRNVRWFTETDISVAHDTELLHLMREAGCAQVLIGLESPVEGALNGLEVKSNWKLRQWPDYREAIETIQRHGISVNGCFVIGLDGHDSSIFAQIFEFVRSSGLHEVQITIQTAFPETPLYERLKKEGRLLREQDWKRLTLFDVNFQPKGMTEQELVQGFRDLAQQLYSKEFTQERRSHFRALMRAGAKDTRAN